MRQIAAAVIELDGKILIAQRAKNDPLYGMWEFPGGKVELGETLQECLTRELSEELGIQATIGEYFCTVPVFFKEMRYEMVVFRVPSFQGEVKLNEHLAIAWVAPEELSNYEMPPADAPIVDLLKRVGKAQDA